MAIHRTDCHRNDFSALQPFLTVHDLVMNDCIELLPLMIMTVTVCMKHQALGFLTAHRKIDKRDLNGDRAVKAVQQLRKLPELDFLFILGQCGVINVGHQITFAVKADCFMPDLYILSIQHHMIGYEAFIGHRLNRCPLSAKQLLQKLK